MLQKSTGYLRPARESRTMETYVRPDGKIEVIIRTYDIRGRRDNIEGHVYKSKWFKPVVTKRPSQVQPQTEPREEIKQGDFIDVNLGGQHHLFRVGRCYDDGSAEVIMRQSDEKVSMVLSGLEKVDLTLLKTWPNQEERYWALSLLEKERQL